jgi:hypothetical protein
MRSWFMRLTLLWTFSIAGWISQLASSSAQETSSPQEIDAAIRSLSSPKSADWEQAEATLKQAMKSPKLRERATLALALLHIKRGNQQAIANLIRKKEGLFTSKSLEVEAQVLRIQLWHDLGSGQGSQAADRFRQLLELTLQGNISDASVVANAALLGAVIGMLEMPQAQSPIEPALLADAKNRILDSKNNQMKRSFVAEYERTNAFATMLDKWLRGSATHSMEETTEATEQATAAANDARDAYKEVQAEKNEIRKRLDQANRHRRASERAIQTIAAVWNNNPQVHNPIKPDRNNIKVPTTREEKDGTEEKKVTRYRTVYDKDGKPRQESYTDTERVTKYITVRRSQQEIDRDIDTIFAQQFRVYSALKESQAKLLKAKADEDSNLSTALTGIEDSESQLLKAKDIQSSAGANGRDLEMKARVAEAGLAFLKSGQLSVFRPPYVEVINYFEEQQVLLK